MTIEFFVGIFVGLTITWLLLKLEGRKSTSEAKQLLTIDDLVIPELLPLFKNHSIERGVNVNDTHTSLCRGIMINVHPSVNTKFTP